ncbi:hypothetical protein [Edwardsiella tarda]|uniref:hypothetical protein n=1 Tax=Edwardsiella tarda TaxID=636 RepID=UPI00351CA58E
MLINQRLGHQGDDGLGDAAPRQLVVQRLLEHVADGTLGIADRIIQRDGGDLVAGQLGTAQDEANLGAVAMRYHQIPARVDHIGDVPYAFHYGGILIGNTVASLILDQGVTADGDDG